MALGLRTGDHMRAVLSWFPLSPFCMSLLPVCRRVRVTHVCGCVFFSFFEITVVAHLRGSLTYIVIYKTSGMLNTQPIYRPGCRAMQIYMLSMGGARGGDS